MAKTGKITVCAGPGEEFVIREHELPEVEPGTALMKIEMCGLCGTDVHYWQGHNPTIGLIWPGVMGHEFVGTLVEIGEGFGNDALGKPLNVGDRIVPAPLVNSGFDFYQTFVGEPVKDEHAQAYGHLGDGPPYHHGGYAEYLYLFLPNTLVYKTDLPPEVAVLLEPMSIAVNAINKIVIRPGEVVVVQGAGPIGLMNVACAKLSGASKVISVDMISERLEMAKKLGADVTINISDVPDKDDRVRLVHEESTGGYGADVVLQCVGVPAAVPEGIDYLRYGGRFCEEGHFADSGTVEINPSLHLCAKLITLKGSWSSTPETFVQALNLMERMDFPYGDVVTHRIPLERTTEGFEVLAGDKIMDGEAAIKIVTAPWEDE
ncbi:MAG: zinc-binding dehydrogenase [Anaerolineales bacterium]|nr:zinc-binding dehydrogenase [Anaerolineales bacterium]